MRQVLCPSLRVGCWSRTNCSRSNPSLRIASYKWSCGERTWRSIPASSQGTRFHRVPVDQVGVEPTCSSLSGRRLDRSASGLWWYAEESNLSRSGRSRATGALRRPKEHAVFPSIVRADVAARSGRSDLVVRRGIEPRSPGLQPGAWSMSACAPCHGVA